jgi:hypothetical protein
MPELPEEPMATAVRLDGYGHFIVDLEDGRSLTVPLEWFVKLRDAPPEKLANVRLLGLGADICWPDLDEDLHVFDLLYPKRFADTLR